jgi:hypothetical protein
LAERAGFPPPQTRAAGVSFSGPGSWPAPEGCFVPSFHYPSLENMGHLTNVRVG